MIIGSHNAWSYLRPKKWWMRLIAWIGKCQHYILYYQYKEGARCFDLHVRFDEYNKVQIVHGLIEYDITSEEGYTSIYDYLDELCNFKNISIRVILDIRTRKSKKFKEYQYNCFKQFCKNLETRYPNIKFWCGRMVKGWELVYDFKYKPSCAEMYGSVTKPKWLWGWYPLLYAFNNPYNIKQGTDKDILLIDFVDINGKNYN